MELLDRLKWCRQQIELGMPNACDYCGGKAVYDGYDHGANCPMMQLAQEIKALEGSAWDD
jgi:hypothetical protein